MAVFNIVVVFMIPLALLLFGYEIACMNRPIHDVKKLFNVSSQRGHLLTNLDMNIHWGIVLTSSSIGSTIAALLIGNIMDKYGRKIAQISVLLFPTVSLVGSVFSVSNWFYSPDLLLFCHTIFGLYVGSSLAIVPSYLGELVPIHHRGKIGLMMDLWITAGYIFGSVLSLPHLLGKFHQWYILYIIEGIFLSLHLFILFFCPESPRYLYLTCDNESKSRHVLTKMGRKSEQIESEIEEMRNEKETVKVRITLWNLVTTRSQWKPLFLGCACSWMLHTCGAISIYYVTNIAFTRAGFSSENSKYVTLGFISFSVLSLLLSFFLVDRVGRRPLLLTGFGGMVVFWSLFSIGLLYSSTDGFGWGNILTIASGIMTIIFSCIGPLGILNFITAEFFTQTYRARAVGISTAIGRIGSCISVSTFPLLLEYLGGYALMIYSGLCVLYWLFTYYFIPETKNRTFLEISRNIRGEQNVIRTNAPESDKS